MTIETKDRLIRWGVPSCIVIFVALGIRSAWYHETFLSIYLPVMAGLMTAQLWWFHWILRLEKFDNFWRARMEEAENVYNGAFDGDTRDQAAQQWTQAYERWWYDFLLPRYGEKKAKKMLLDAGTYPPRVKFSYKKS